MVALSHPRYGVVGVRPKESKPEALSAGSWRGICWVQSIWELVSDFEVGDELVQGYSHIRVLFEFSNISQFPIKEVSISRT